MASNNWIPRVRRCATLGQMITENSRSHPRRRAISLGPASLNYRDLDRLSNRYASALRARLGVRAGERVAVLLRNSIEFVVVSLGALKAGAVVVPLNHFLTAPELKYILDDSGAAVLVSSDDFAATVRGFSGDVPALRACVTVGREDLGNETWLSEELLKGARNDAPERGVGSDDTAVIIYTSGTTGRPKGAMLSHGNLLSNILSAGECIRISKSDRLMLILPMFHSFTFTVCILMPLAAGAAIIVVRKLRSLPHMIRNLMLKRATVLIGIPHVYELMSHAGPPFWMRPMLSLRLCVSGSAPLAEATLRNFERRWRTPLLEGYGLSETSPVVSFNPIDGRRKAGSVGRPIPGVSVRIVSGDGSPLPPGRVGEIAVKGPNVMQGYLNRVRETKETIRDGWLMTGDIGKIDEEGYIYILDRKKDMILVRGMNVYPREIEEVLYSHPSVAEAAVVGRTDSRRGEVPVAVISLKEGASATPQEIVHFCARSLAPYKVPRTVLIIDRLPRTSSGKILKRALKRDVNDLTSALYSDTSNKSKEEREDGSQKEI